MLKRIVVLLLFVQISYSQYAQKDAFKLCVALQSNNFLSNVEANKAIQKIMNVIGISQPPILQACDNINNAVAITYRGERYILYDPIFMQVLSENGNKYWNNMFILAHELGHHINGHPVDMALMGDFNIKSLEERREQELEADEFAGFVLAKLGASFKQASEIFQNLPEIPNENTSTHPSNSRRIEAIKKGFQRDNSSFSEPSNLKYKIVLQSEDEFYNEWDYSIQKPKENKLKNLTNPFERKKIIDDAKIPDEEKVSWVYAKIFDENSKLIESSSRLVIKQMYWENFAYEGDEFKLTYFYLFDTNIEKEILKLFPEELHDRLKIALSKRQHKIDFVFDDGYSGSFVNGTPILGIDGVNSQQLFLIHLDGIGKGEFIEKLKTENQLFLKFKSIDKSFLNTDFKLYKYLKDNNLLLEDSDYEKFFKTYQIDLKDSFKALEYKSNIDTY